MKMHSTYSRLSERTGWAGPGRTQFKDGPAQRRAGRAKNPRGPAGSILKAGPEHYNALIVAALDCTVVATTDLLGYVRMGLLCYRYSRMG